MGEKLKTMKTKIKNYLRKKKNQFLKSKFLVFVLGATIGIAYTYIYMTAPLLFQSVTKTIEINNRASAEVASGIVGGAVKASPLGKVQQGKNTPEGLITRYFGNDAPMAIAIAKCESSLDYKRIGDQDKQYYKNGRLYGKSCGLFQIRLFPNRPDCDYLLDTENNVKYAKQLFNKKGWQPWSCYTNGNYKKFLK